MERWATFDCYGTLIDWEAGLLAALRPILSTHRAGPGSAFPAAALADDALLETYGRHEAALEAGDYLEYREVLGWDEAPDRGHEGDRRRIGQ